MTTPARARRGPATSKYNAAVEENLLGGLSPRDFLRRHWQKRPLLVRAALRKPPSFSLGTLAALAARDDTESRLVLRRGRRWRLEHGPLAPRALAAMPRRGWTLLVQGLNHHAVDAETLLQRFSFIPQARLDDVMASYAVAGGGVGPHWDSYDVFLVQAAGRRVWNLCRPQAFAALSGAPLRIIDGFEAEDEYLLEPGDMLYLPPGWGHDGIALEPSVTLSVGFRAPGGAELGAAFLDFLADRGLPDSRYRDPDLRPTRRPAEISATMLRRTRAMLERIRWTRRDMDEFAGTWLSTPKPHVVFSRPARPLASDVFAKRLATATVLLDPKTRLLYQGRHLFINGESLPAAGRRYAGLRSLADARRLAGARLGAEPAGPLVYQWYRDGYLHLA